MLDFKQEWVKGRLDWVLPGWQIVSAETWMWCNYGLIAAAAVCLCVANSCSSFTCWSDSVHYSGAVASCALSIMLSNMLDPEGWQLPSMSAFSVSRWTSRWLSSTRASESIPAEMLQAWISGREENLTNVFHFNTKACSDSWQSLSFPTLDDHSNC